MQRAGQDRLHVHLPQRPDGPGPRGYEGLQPGARILLGVLQLRKDLSPAGVVPMGASVVPLRGSEDIMWTVKFRNGTIKRFKFPIRTTAEGSAVPDGGYPEGPGDLKDQNLWTEPASVGVDVLPTKK